MELKTIESSCQGHAFDDARRAVQILKVQGSYFRLIGAGCGSMVSYLTELSEIDPIAHGLSYERFLEANSARTVQFQFVAQLKTEWNGAEHVPLQDEFSNCAIRIQQATSFELMPSFIADEVRRSEAGFSLTSIPLNDKATFEALRLGHVGGIRPLDGPGEKRLLSDIKPRCLTDIATITAIRIADDGESGMLDEFIQQRVKLNRRMHDELKILEMLNETRGMILFQEQIMLILNRVADIPLADAYSFIKAVCKRQWEQVGTFREWFVAGAVGNGVNEPEALTLFERIRNAATRAACKAHYLSEALAIYQTAFLKTHFSREFDQTLHTIQQ
jgi:DNA polymerase III alpha subunit